LLCAFLCVLCGEIKRAQAQSSDLVPAHDYSILDARTNHAYRQLIHAHVFNFGGVGFANAITPEEKAFHILLGSNHRLALFKRLLRDADAEGQLSMRCTGCIWTILKHSRDKWQRSARILSRSIAGKAWLF
jgi:hypothetical protein